MSATPRLAVSLHTNEGFISQARRGLDLIGDGDWTPQDSILVEALGRLERATREVQRLDAALTRAMDRGNELERLVEMARDPERWDEFLASIGSAPDSESPTPPYEHPFERFQREASSLDSEHDG